MMPGHRGIRIDPPEDVHVDKKAKTPKKPKSAKPKPATKSA
jgi:hypothetical protein